MQIEKNLSMADVICDLRIKKIKSTFFNQMEILIDWRLLTNIIKKLKKPNGQKKIY
jgi:IS5 family transposase